MTRICQYCQKDMGEKCGHCGNMQPMTVFACGSAINFKCPSCGHTWSKGSERVTTGICEECLDREVRAMRATRLEHWDQAS